MCLPIFQELQHIRNSLPDAVKLQRVEERLSALGNVIACNDYVALTHPDLDRVSQQEFKKICQLTVDEYFCYMRDRHVLCAMCLMQKPIIFQSFISSILSVIFCTNVLEQKIKRNNLICFVISFVLKICFSVPKNPKFVHHTWGTTQQRFIRKALPRVQPLTFKVYMTQIFLQSYFSSTICVKYVFRI